jgi:hypothetical protein
MLFALWFACVDGSLGDPSIVLIAPADGATVCGDPLHVEIAIDNFTLVDPSEGSTPHPGEGHVDVTLNGQAVDMTPDASFDIPDVVDGEYQLAVELVNADHTALEPFAGDFVFITVDSTTCP